MADAPAPATTTDDSSSSNASSFMAGASIISSLASISMTYDQGKLRRSIAEHNRIMSEYDAWFAQHAAKQAEKMLRREEKRLLGTARAINSASGFATDSATNLAVEGDIMTGVALDVAVIRTRGGLEAFRSMSAAGQYGLQASSAQIESNLKIAEILARDTPKISKMFAKKDE
ncbi:hypothetical protein KAR91_11935 [Candidatus Pacearchaeota archaeon]|nr:hypothetical protein [Candidatus Pacearchaeota archaeon]